MVVDCLSDTMLPELGLEVIDERWHPGETADRTNHVDGVIQSGGSDRHQSAPQASSRNRRIRALNIIAATPVAAARRCRRRCIVRLSRSTDAPQATEHLAAS